MLLELGTTYYTGGAYMSVLVIALNPKPEP